MFPPEQKESFERAMVADLRIVAYTAEPGSEAADRLALLAVIGTQALT